MSGPDQEHEFGEWCYQFGPHLLTITYRRPLWRPWRKLYVIRCFECDVIVHEWWAERSIRLIARQMHWKALGDSNAL